MNPNWDHNGDKPIQIVCSDCGGTNVCRDATAVWSTQLQKWVLGGVQDQGTCMDCDDDDNLKEVDLHEWECQQAEAQGAAFAMAAIKEHGFTPLDAKIEDPFGVLPLDVAPGLSITESIIKEVGEFCSVEPVISLGEQFDPNNPQGPTDTVRIGPRQALNVGIQREASNAAFADMLKEALAPEALLAEVRLEVGEPVIGIIVLDCPEDIEDDDDTVYVGIAETSATERPTPETSTMPQPNQELAEGQVFTVMVKRASDEQLVSWYFDVQKQWQFALDEAHRLKVLRGFGRVGLPEGEVICDYDEFYNWLHYLDERSVVLHGLTEEGFRKYVLQSYPYAKFRSTNSGVVAIYGQEPNMNEPDCELVAEWHHASGTGTLYAGYRGYRSQPAPDANAVSGNPKARH